MNGFFKRLLLILSAVTVLQTNGMEVALQALSSDGGMAMSWNVVTNTAMGICCASDPLKEFAKDVQQKWFVYASDPDIFFPDLGNAFVDTWKNPKFWSHLHNRCMHRSIYWASALLHSVIRQDDNMYHPAVPNLTEIVDNYLNPLALFGYPVSIIPNLAFLYGFNSMAAKAVVVNPVINGFMCNAHIPALVANVSGIKIPFSLHQLALYFAGWRTAHLPVAHEYAHNQMVFATIATIAGACGVSVPFLTTKAFLMLMVPTIGLQYLDKKYIQKPCRLCFNRMGLGKHECKVGQIVKPITAALVAKCTNKSKSLYQEVPAYISCYGLFYLKRFVRHYIPITTFVLFTWLILPRLQHAQIV